ncbi:MAG: TIGR03905 family TSCPD domain-containing protein [Spirochaetaceae bacterium]|nr:TIGR03905 family TSCPD domain-containing protein [Spirochaetaceae bacterium]
MYKYETEGVCATAISFDIKDGKICDVKFENGCNGNLKAIGTLVDGMDAHECIKKLKGIRCGFRETSCSDQFACALELALEKTQ